MDYLSLLSSAVSYLEAHLKEDPSYLDVSEAVALSPYHFMRVWKAVTGYTVDEYVRKRKLYLAALDLSSSKETVLEVGYRYGYQTPESFTKAFVAFHGVTPTYARKHRGSIHPFLPLEITTSIKGGHLMEFTIEKKKAFKIIGFKRSFDTETAYDRIPAFWGEAMKKLCDPSSSNRSLIEKCHICEYGVCVSKPNCKDFDYYIAGDYHGEKVPEGYEVLEVPAHLWARFRCLGKLPGAMQSVNTRIYAEWLPNNKEYEMDGNIDLEYYSEGDGQSDNYESEIWLPIKKK